MSRCWAHDQAGHRCDLDASDHDKHQYTVTWDDDVVWVPVLDLPMREEVRISNQPETVDRLCIVCGHDDHGDVECPETTPLADGERVLCGCLRSATRPA